MWYRKLRTSVTSLGKDESGASAVEFALVAALLLLPLMLGIIQFGMLLYTHNNMVQAAREASRILAKKDKVFADAEAAAARELKCDDPDGVPCNRGSGWVFTITRCAPDTAVTCQGSDWPSLDPFNDVSVKITVPFSQASLIDVFGLFSTSDPLEAQVSMRKQK